MNIAFDVHGTLDNDPEGHLRKLFDTLLENKFFTIYIISGPPIAQIMSDLEALNINPFKVTIISLVDYLHKQGVHMWRNNDNWWCADAVWWASKGMICFEYEIDIIYDDKLRYKQHIPERTKFVHWV